MKLNKRDIDAAQYEGDGRKPHILWDDDVRGLGLRVFPSGRKSWVLKYRPRGSRRTRLLTLGPWGVLTASAARSLALRTLADVLEGKDPLESRKMKSVSKDLSMADLSSRYIEEYAKAHKKTWQEDLRRLEGCILPTLGKRPIKEVRREDAAALATRIGKTAPYEANRVLALISVLFSRAREWGMISESHPNPAKGVKRFRERSRDRWLRKEEVQRLASALEHESDPFSKAALKLYLLTGMRKSELLSVRWENVDLARREIYLPQTKSGRPHALPLSQPAVEILTSLPRQLGSPWVFPGKGDGHLKDVKATWERVRERSNLKDVRLHDLRRTLGSWAVQEGVPLQVVGEILNHTHPEITKVYARLQDSQRRAALEVVGRRMAEALSGSNPTGP